MLLRAMQAFLNDGFEAASYEHIAREMGLSKPSLYNTFGDKLSLFKRVLDDYAIRASKQIVDSFSHQDTLEQGAQNLLRSAATFYSQPNGRSHGCLLVGTALPACTQYDDIRKILARFTQSLDQLLENVIDKQYANDAQACGLPSHILAVQISSLIFALAIRARAGLSRQQLLTYADELAETVSKKL